MDSKNYTGIKMISDQQMTFKNTTNRFFGFYIDIEFWVVSHTDQFFQATIEIAKDQVISFEDFVNDSKTITKSGDFCLSNQIDMYYKVKRKHYYQSQNDSLNNIIIKVKSGILGIKMFSIYFQNCIEDCDYCDEKKCLQCSTNNSYDEQNNLCIFSCYRGYYSKDKICKKCIDNCDICKDDSTCLQCSNGYQLNNNQCIEQCISGFDCIKGQYTNCKKMNFLENKCEQCQDNYYLKNDVCDTQCKDDGWYSIDNTFDCYRCQNDCIFCDETSCKQCDYGYTHTGQNCDPCGNNCKYCQIKSKCRLCMNNKVLQGNQCEDQCNIGYFNRDYQCLKCAQTLCEECENEGFFSCKKCQKGYKLENEICVQETQNTNCHSTCKICISSNYCAQCKVAYHKIYYGICSLNCPSGFVAPNNSKICQPCYSTECLDCSDTSKNSCNKCIQGFYLLDNECVASCPERYVADNKNQQCQKCKVDNCAICDFENQQCSSCLSSYILHENKCISKCPDYYGKIGDKCKQCIPNCINCDQNDQLCQKCQSLFVYDNEKKICDCEKGYILDKGNCLKKCQVQYCEDCQSTDTCIQCKKNYFLTDENSCVASCKDGYNENSLSFTCDQCKVQNCQKCNRDINTCTECMKDYFLYQNQCVQQCQSGYTEAPDKTCKKCLVKDCAECKFTNLDICSGCMTKFILLDNNTCLAQCPKYYIVQKNSCQQKPPAKFSITSSSESYIYYVNLEEQIDEPVINEEQCIQVDIPKLQQGLYITPQVTQLNDKKQYKLQLKVNLVNFIIQTIKCLPYFDESEQQISLDISPQMTEEEEKVSDVIQSTSQISKSIAQNSFFPLAIFGNLRYLASLFDISQLINMMIFVNVELPQNLRTLFDSLEEFQIPIKNLFTFLPNYDEIEYELEGKFEQEGKNGFFLDNAGDTISMFGILIVSKLLLKGFINLSKKSQFINNKIQRLHNFLFSGSWIYDLIDVSYNQLCFGVFLQMISFTRATYIEEYINYGCLILAVNIILLPILFVFLFKQGKLKNLLDHITKQYSCQGYPFVLFFRKFIFSLSLAFIQKSALAQLILLACMHTFTLFFIARYKPLKKKYLNVKEFISSFLFLNATAFMVVLVYGELLEVRFCYNISWIILVSFGLIIVIDGLIFICEALIFLIGKIKQLRNYCLKRKETQKQDKKEKKRPSKVFEINQQRRQQSLNIYGNVINSGDLILEKLNQNDNESDQKSDFIYSGFQLNAKYSNIQDSNSQCNILLNKKQMSSETVQQSQSLQSTREHNQNLNFEKQFQRPSKHKKSSAEMTTINNIDIEISDAKSNY